jgi:hypothetical protein
MATLLVIPQSNLRNNHFGINLPQVYQSNDGIKTNPFPGFEQWRSIRINRMAPQMLSS